MRLSLLLFLHSSVFILVGQKFFRKKKVSKTRERETVKGEKYRKVACGSYYHYDQSDDRLLPATANKLMASPFLTCIICCLLPVSTSSFFSLLFSSSCCYYSPCPRGGLLCVKSCNVYARTRGSRLQKKKFF